MTVTDPTDGKPGLRLETAASVTLRDTIIKHMHAFGHVIKHDRLTGRAVVSAYVDGLAGAMAFVIAGGNGSRDEVTAATLRELHDAIARDLAHLGQKQ